MPEGRGEFKDAPIGVRVYAAIVLGKSQGDFVEQQEIRQDVIYHLSWEDPDPPKSPHRASGG